MKPKIILYIATTLDGFIARKDGSIDFLKLFENIGEDYGYNEFYKNIDVIVMGRKTYEQVLTFEEFPYKNKECFVFTRDKKMSNNNINNNIVFINEDIKEFVRRFENKNLWLVRGSEIIKEFLKFNIIDEFIITIIPILLGDGIPLFNKVFNEIKLDLIHTRRYNNGLIQLSYKKS